MEEYFAEFDLLRRKVEGRMRKEGIPPDAPVAVLRLKNAAGSRLTRVIWQCFDIARQMRRVSDPLGGSGETNVSPVDNGNSKVPSPRATQILPNLAPGRAPRRRPSTPVRRHGVGSKRPRFVRRQFAPVRRPAAGQVTAAGWPAALCRAMFGVKSFAWIHKRAAGGSGKGEQVT